MIGDIGRSPRMCYHALSLADHKFNVQIVGYTDSAANPRIASNPLIKYFLIFKKKIKM